MRTLYRCRECGKTAITRAENDEILNEAWCLLMNVTEEDGVTTAEANGMLKLMNFFLYKYHGLKKKPEWAESVEARLANPMAKEHRQLAGWLKELKQLRKQTKKWRVNNE